MPKILSDRIIWDSDDWFGGLSPQSRNNTLNTTYQRNINPFRVLGAIGPGYMPVSVTNVDLIDSVIRAGESDYSGTTPYAYLISQGGKIYKLDLATDTIDNSGWTHQITHHASVVGQDLKIVNVVNGVTSTASTMALYSFYDGTDGDVGAYDISSGLGVFDDDFLSTQPTGALTLTTDPHPMVFGDDGKLYIGNGRTLVRFDGETGGNGTVTVALTLPRGTIIRSFAKHPDGLLIYASRSNNVSGSFYRGNSTAYFWDYVSDNFNYPYDLSDNMVTAGFNWLGIPGCVTYGRTGEGNGAVSSKLKLFTGSRFKQILEYPSNPPGHGSVEIHDSMILWVFGTSGSQSWIGSYGTPWEDRIKGSFNYWGEPRGTSLDSGTTGLCSNLGGTKLYVASGYNSSSALETFSAGYGPIQSSGSYFQALPAKLTLPSGKAATVKSIKVHFNKASTAGRTFNLTLYFNGITTQSVVLSGLGTNSVLTKEYIVDTSGTSFPHFHSIKPYLTWDTGTDSTDAPLVEKIEVLIDIVNFIQG